MSQTREKWDFLVLSRGDFEVIRKCHSISCFHFCFLFRNNGKRQQVGENGFRRCYDNFFSKVLFLKYFITIMFTVLSQQLWRLQCLQQLKQLPRQLHLKDTLRLKDLMEMDQHRRRHVPRHLTYYCMLLHLSNKPSF